MIGTIYLLHIITESGEEASKIGFTTSCAEKRVKQLQTGSFCKISILRTYKTRNYRKVEKALHRRFRCLTSSENEWRRLSDEDTFNFLDICSEIDSNIEYLLKYNSLYK